jgi:hypothetical protein
VGIRGKAAGPEADHSPPSSAKVKNVQTYTSTHSHIFMVWCLVKHRDNFTFTTVNGNTVGSSTVLCYNVMRG